MTDLERVYDGIEDALMFGASWCEMVERREDGRLDLMFEGREYVLTVQEKA